MEGSNKSTCSVSNKSEDGVDLGSALNVRGMIPVGGEIESVYPVLEWRNYSN